MITVPELTEPAMKNTEEKERTEGTLEGSVSTNSAKLMQRSLIPFGAFVSLNYLYLHQFVFIFASFFFVASTPVHPWFRHLIVIFVTSSRG